MDTVNDPYLRHQYGNDSVCNVYCKNVTNMSVGTPGPDLLKYCTEMLKISTEHRMNEEKNEGQYFLFQYGITAGLWECRDELAKFLTRRYGDSVKREQLILSCGASHGLQTLLTTIVSPNGIIFVEEVTYMTALDAFKQFPLMEIITVSMKDDLVDLDDLEEKIASKKHGKYFHNSQKIFWAMFYTIPTFQNPTGMCLSPENCKRLVAIARKNDLLVVCDDVYNLLHYGDGFPPHRLFYYDNSSDSDFKGGNVVSNGTFSKILSPGIRLGWIESSARIINILKQSGVLSSSGAVNHYVSGVIASLLHLNIEDEYLDTVVKTYRDRLNTMSDILNQFLPAGCSFRKPNGGYFIWIHLPEGVDGLKFVTWCQNEYKVAAIPGAWFSYTGEQKNFLRLSIAFHSADVLKNASKNLCIGLLEYLKNHVKYHVSSTKNKS